MTTSDHKSTPYRCAGCRRHFSVKIGTGMERSGIGYRQWVLAIYQVVANAKGISSMKLHRDLGISQPTAWFMLHRLREAMGSLARPEAMGGPVEVDKMCGGVGKKTSTLTRKARSKK